MAARRYNQYCAAARALDLVGDRWTLLLVRELMLGPRRYSDLLDGLKGIGTNLLAARLKTLEEAGVLGKKALPPPAPATVYELTERGRELEPVVIALARWGLALLGTPDPAEEWRPAWSTVAMRATFRPEAAVGIEETYQFCVDGESFWARVRDGEATTGRGEAPSPAVTVTAEASTFLAVAAGELSVDAATRSGTYDIEGDVDALARCIGMFALPGTN